MEREKQRESFILLSKVWIVQVKYWSCSSGYIESLLLTVCLAFKNIATHNENVLQMLFPAFHRHAALTMGVLYLWITTSLVSGTTTTGARNRTQNSTVVKTEEEGKEAERRSECEGGPQGETESEREAGRKGVSDRMRKSRERIRDRE